MKIYIKIVLLLLLPVFASAQSGQNRLDSLHVTLNNASNDTIRMDVYHQLGILYLERNRDSSLFYLNQCVSHAQKLNLKIYEALGLNLKGYVLMQLGNYPKSLESFLQAFKIAEDPANEKNNWRPFGRGQTPQNARLNALGWIYHNMGHLYGRTGNTDTQIANYFKAISLAESVQDTFLLSLANMNLGDVYLSLSKLDSALLFSQKALRFNSSGRGGYKGAILKDIGDIYRQKGIFTEALAMYLKSEQINTEQNNLTNLGGSYSSLARLYETLQKPDSSLFYAKKGLENAKNIGQPQQMAWAYKVLSDVYSSQQNRDSTLKYLQLYSVLIDSLNNAEKKNLLAYQNVGFDEQIRLKKLEEEKIQMQTKIRTNSLAGGLFTLIVIAFFLYRNNRNKQKANKLLQEQKEEIQTTLEQLEAAQSQLIQSEKMASLGELTAGIAHEIQNPLNFVNNFSEVSNELMDEMDEEIVKGDIEEAREIAKDIKQNLEKINHHGKRADAIVKGMLQHSRTSSGQKEPTDINALADEYLRLAYHGFLAKDNSFNADFKTEFDKSLPKIEVVPQDIGRVLLNLINNAFYAVDKRAKDFTPQPPEGGVKNAQTEYHPTVVVSTSFSKSPSGDLGVILTVKDNGDGINKNIVDKIFQPFFTTKPTGSGTGLGLSLSYDIIKAHGGEISVESEEGKGTEFIVYLPTS